MDSVPQQKSLGVGFTDKTVRQETPTSALKRRTLLALAGAAFLIPGSTDGITHRAPARIPDVYIQDLLRRTEVGHNYTDGEFAAANYIAESNRDGGEVSAAIMQLEGVHPNLAIAQLWQLLSAPSHGNSLSRTERQAIVYLSNTWPDRFEPFYTGENVATTRTELIAQLKSYPALQRSFRRYERPVTEIVASDVPRSTD